MSAATPCRVLHVTLESGDPDVIDASKITQIQTTHGRTWVECGRLVYVVREKPLALRLQLQRTGIIERVPTTTTARVYSA